MKKIVILGSTGSIGQQTLEVIKAYPQEFKIVGLSCNKNWQRLLTQIKKFKPPAVAVFNLKAAKKLKKKIVKEKIKKIKVFSGEKGLLKLACWPSAQMTVIAIVGATGIKPALKAIRAKKQIALATKEIMVAAGDLINKAAKKEKVKIIPIDSEHSAIFQCLSNSPQKEIRKIYLTCSGGSFRGKTRDQLKNVTIKQALEHPNWQMGSKITIDSATLMNKGLEVIEAMKLFDLSLNQIKVIVHPQSIIHSMVEFIDGNILAQLGPPNMRFAIRHALSYPKRLINNLPFLNFLEHNHLTFEEPDIKTFPCLKLALQAAKKEGTMPAVMNAANEIAVKAFLKGKIKFLEIPKLVEKIMKKHKIIKNPNLKQIFNTDKWAQKMTLKEINNG